MALTARERRILLAYRTGAFVCTNTPPSLALPVVGALGRASVLCMPAKRALVARHLRRACGEPLDGPDSLGAVARSFDSYARYWFDTFRLPTVPPAEIEARFTIEGDEHMAGGLAKGRGVILALPHLGSWEVGARWAIECMGRPMAAVVEVLDPPELFEWFRDQRQAIGIDVIPLDDRAFAQIVRHLNENHLVSLLADRDITGTGVDVEFFGERTRLPAGPALAALRTGADLLPAAVYTRPHSRYAAEVRPPLDTTRQGSLRDDVARITQALAVALEELIRAAPEQWHIMQPNWPSDPGVPHMARVRRPEPGDDGARDASTSDPSTQPEPPRATVSL